MNKLWDMVGKKSNYSKKFIEWRQDIINKYKILVSKEHNYLDSIALVVLIKYLPLKALSESV